MASPVLLNAMSDRLENRAYRSRTGLAALMAFAGLGLVIGFVRCGTDRLDSAPYDSAVTTRDGVQRAVTIYPVPNELPPGVLLLHGLGEDRASWSSFGRRAQEAGFLCLAIDFRGHGVNGGGRSYREFGSGEWRNLLLDVAAGKAALVKLGADPNSLAVAGASLGANVALTYAATDRDLQAVVMISPGLEYETYPITGLMHEFGGRPVLMITSEGDTYSSSSAETLKSSATVFCELRTYPGSLHGADLLAASEGPNVQIIQWLETILIRAS